MGGNGGAAVERRYFGLDALRGGMMMLGIVLHASEMYRAARVLAPLAAALVTMLPITAALCFASYHYLVQRSWVSVFLNGRRFELAWPWR